MYVLHNRFHHDAEISWSEISFFTSFIWAKGINKNIEFSFKYKLGASPQRFHKDIMYLQKTLHPYTKSVITYRRYINEQSEHSIVIFNLSIYEKV